MKLVTIPNRRKRGAEITLEWIRSNTIETDPPPDSGLKTPCLIWQGAISTNGYGQMSIARTGRVVHKVAFELAYGTVPPDRVLDHLCETRTCVNHEHLEPVPGAVNTRRGRACRKGAPCARCGGTRFSAYKKQRRCLDCKKDADKKQRQKSGYRAQQNAYRATYRERQRHADRTDRAEAHM